MKNFGIIAEYNPFHKGHEYQIKLAKEEYGAKHVIVVMSGNYNERGLPAIIEKKTRALFAIQAGADLVIELPVCYALSDIDKFALGAISLLNNIGIVDCLLFGSESGNIEELENMSNIMQTKEYRAKYLNCQHYRNNDKREYCFEELGLHQYAKRINSPNNLLGIKYIDAIRTTNSNLKVITHKRVGSEYFDKYLYEYNIENGFSSATAIRRSLMESFNTKKNIEKEIKLSVPEYVYKWMNENWKKEFPIFNSDFADEIYNKIKQNNNGSLNTIEGCSNDFVESLFEDFNELNAFEDYYHDLSKKNYNVNIDRLLFRILTLQKYEDIFEYMQNGIVFYINILAKREDCEPLIGLIEQNTNIPIISENKALKKLNSLGVRQLENCRRADEIYLRVKKNKFGFNGGRK